MKDEIMRYVSYDQILRYLHHNETIEIDASMKVMIQEALDEALSLSTFKHFFQYEPITIKSSSITLTKGSMLFKSKELSDFIHEAKALVLAGVTLGHGIGKRIENRMLIKPSYGIILDACASVLTDAFCDYLQDQWIQTHAFEEKFISQRYSPGYGDFEITENKKIAERLNLDKKIGVFTTEQGQLLPEKSVIFVMGLSEKQFRTQIKTCGGSCETCRLKHCTYRRETNGV